MSMVEAKFKCVMALAVTALYLIFLACTALAGTDQDAPSVLGQADRAEEFILWPHQPRVLRRHQGELKRQAQHLGEYGPRGLRREERRGADVL